MNRCRCRIAARLLLAVVIIACGSPAFALNPQLDISQYWHTSWRIADGFLRDPITAIAQTTDGYLWLGTDDGLFRFDGVRAVPWLPSGQPLPSVRILNLLGSRDGHLWIGTDQGVMSWHEGRLTSYAIGDAPYRTGRLLESRDGSIRTNVFNPRTGTAVVCTLRNGRAECQRVSDDPARRPMSLYEDRAGRLWAGAGTGLWRLQPEPAHFFPLEFQVNGIQGIAEDENGTLLISRRGRIERLVDRKVELWQRLPAHTGRLFFNEALVDRDGGLWLGGRGAGLVHVHRGAVDAYSRSDGLTGEGVNVIFEDREGNIWIGTSEGLDRFRDVAVAQFSTGQGLSNASANAFLSARDGSVWISTYDRLTNVSRDEVVVYGDQAQQEVMRVSRPARGVRGVTVPGLPSNIGAVFQDRLERIWTSATGSGVAYLENGRLTPVNGLPSGLTRAITQDRLGAMWIVDQGRGVFRIPRDGAAVEAIPSGALGRTDPVSAAVGDPLGGGVWLGFSLGDLVLFAGDRVQSTYGAAEGLPAGRVGALHFDHDGALWIVASSGLARLKNGRLTTLTRANGLPCDVVHWIMDDAAGRYWIATPCGLVRVEAAGIAAWIAAAERGDTGYRIDATVLGDAKGFRVSSTINYYTSFAARSSDGRLWFHTNRGVGVLDPGHLPHNGAPPPVVIEQLTADRIVHNPMGGGLRLPPLTRNLQIDYTALSFVAPELNRFRYRLEGRDNDWQDVGTRRQAYFSDLAPGQYRFRVIASNNDGVWNEEGASVDFEIAAAYYQTNWFLALVAGMLLSLIWAAHRLRLRIVETHEREITALNEKLMSAQEQERIRIAGELHDGVMQQMLAATMLLGSAKRRIGADSEAHVTIDKAQQKLVQAGTDIRQLSHDLHPPALQELGLADALRSHCEDFSTSSGIPITCDADSRVNELSRGAALALFRIVQEALGNAAKHSKATRITVGLVRSASEVSLTVSDNGVGFDRGLLTSSGGLGLITMRERAGQLNGTFEFNTAPGRGTTIKVVVPFR